MWENISWSGFPKALLLTGTVLEAAAVTVNKVSF